MTIPIILAVIALTFICASIAIDCFDRWRLQRFQFSLRTLFVVSTVMAVILGTRALMVRPVSLIWDFGVKYDDSSWWIAPLIIDAAAIAAGVWFVRRK